MVSVRRAPAWAGVKGARAGKRGSARRFLRRDGFALHGAGVRARLHCDPRQGGQRRQGLDASGFAFANRFFQHAGEEGGSDSDDAGRFDHQGGPQELDDRDGARPVVCYFEEAPLGFERGPFAAGFDAPLAGGEKEDVGLDVVLRRAGGLAAVGLESRPNSRPLVSHVVQEPIDHGRAQQLSTATRRDRRSQKSCATTRTRL